MSGTPFLDLAKARAKYDRLKEKGDSRRAQSRKWAEEQGPLGWLFGKLTGIDLWSEAEYEGWEERSARHEVERLEKIIARDA